MCVYKCVYYSLVCNCIAVCVFQLSTGFLILPLEYLCWNLVFLLAGDKQLDGYQKKKYVCKLLFIFLLGHDIDFGHMEAVNLLSSNKYTEKQIVSISTTSLCCCTTMFAFCTPNGNLVITKYFASKKHSFHQLNILDLCRELKPRTAEKCLDLSVLS